MAGRDRVDLLAADRAVLAGVRIEAGESEARRRICRSGRADRGRRCARSRRSARASAGPARGATARGSSPGRPRDPRSTASSRSAAAARRRRPQAPRGTPYGRDAGSRSRSARVWRSGLVTTAAASPARTASTARVIDSIVAGASRDLRPSRNARHAVAGAERRAARAGKRTAASAGVLSSDRDDRGPALAQRAGDGRDRREQRRRDRRVARPACSHAVSASSGPIPDGSPCVKAIGRDALH